MRSFSSFRVNSSVSTSAPPVNWLELISRPVSIFYKDLDPMMILLLSFSLVLILLFLPDLLEKARVISQQTLERSYHIFYQMMSGSVNGLKGAYGFLVQEQIKVW